MTQNKNLIKPSGHTDNFNNDSLSKYSLFEMTRNRNLIKPSGHTDNFNNDSNVDAAKERSRKLASSFNQLHFFDIYRTCLFQFENQGKIRNSLSILSRLLGPEISELF